MNELMAVFDNLTAPQAEVITSAITLASALIVALVAPLTFHLLTRGGVKGFNDAVADLKVAADSAAAQSQTIRDSMGVVRNVSTEVSDLGVLIASVQEALANTQNTLLEGRAEATAENGHDTGTRERIKTLWRGLQEMVERLAARPSIHGHTRARYARIDRRGYLKLIGTLLDEGHLAGGIDDWKAAYYLWTAARQAAAEPAASDVERMQTLERVLRGANGSGDAAEAGARPTHPSLSPEVLMTPRNVEAESARDQLRAGLNKATRRNSDRDDQASA